MRLSGVRFSEAAPSRSTRAHSRPLAVRGPAGVQRAVVREPPGAPGRMPFSTAPGRSRAVVPSALRRSSRAPLRLRSPPACSASPHPSPSRRRRPRLPRATPPSRSSTGCGAWSPTSRSTASCPVRVRPRAGHRPADPAGRCAPGAGLAVRVRPRDHAGLVDQTINLTAGERASAGIGLGPAARPSSPCSTTRRCCRRRAAPPWPCAASPRPTRCGSRPAAPRSPTGSPAPSRRSRRSRRHLPGVDHPGQRRRPRGARPGRPARRRPGDRALPDRQAVRQHARLGGPDRPAGLGHRRPAGVNTGVGPLPVAGDAGTVALVVGLPVAVLGAVAVRRRRALRDPGRGRPLLAGLALAAACAGCGASSAAAPAPPSSRPTTPAAVPSPQSTADLLGSRSATLDALRAEPRCDRSACRCRASTARRRSRRTRPTR